MKVLIAFLSLVLLTGFTSEISSQGINVVWKAGIFESYDCEREAIYGNHQADKYVCDDFRLVKETAKIPMTVGIVFGFDYQIDVPNLTSCYTETRVLEHPPITQPDGK